MKKTEEKVTVIISIPDGLLTKLIHTFIVEAGKVKLESLKPKKET